MSTILCLCPDERDHPNVAGNPRAITVPCPDRHCDQHTGGPHWHTILPQPYCPLHGRTTAPQPATGGGMTAHQGSTTLRDVLDAIDLQLVADSDEVTLTRAQAELLADYLTFAPQP